MSSRKSQAEFEREIHSLLPNISVLGKYVNNKTRVDVKCNTCGHEWSPMAQSLLSGHGCQQCAGNGRLSQNEFEKRVADNSLSIAIVGTYVRSSATIAVKCKVCGYEWNPKAYSLLGGKGCPLCQGVKRKTTKEFIEQLTSVNPDLVLLSQYKNNRTPVSVGCNKCHNEWITSPKSILRGSGCPRCAKERISSQSAKSAEIFEKELYATNPRIRIIGTYKNSKTPIEVYCMKCGYHWEGTPNILLKSKGCPICTGKSAVWKGVNDLETTNPTLASEWFYDKNAPLLPSEVRAGSSKKVWWRGKCGHFWNASIASRNKGSGCQVCANNIRKTTQKFINELSEFNPHIEIIGEYQGAIKPILVRCLICGYEWSCKPNSLLHGSGCTNCVRNQTSFMEQFLLSAFRKVLSEELVLSRNTTAIGLELDIYIPSLQLALEPGSWLYHESKASGLDSEKRNRCAEENIRLITIYDTYPRNAKPPFDTDCYVFEGFLNEYGFARIIQLTKGLMFEYGLKGDDIDWITIADEAYLACHYNADESFKQELSMKYPNIRVLEQYKGSNIPILVKNTTCSHRPWRARPYTLLKGIGCPECARVSNAVAKTKTSEQFASELKQINPTITILTPYEKVRKRINVQCVNCGYSWSPIPYSLLSGKGCPHCSAIQAARNRKNKLASKTTEQFIDELKQINPTIKIMGEYVNSKTKLTVQCLCCNHIWDVVPASLLNGHGCPVCARKKKHRFSP